MGGTPSHMTPEEVEAYNIAVQKERIIGGQMSKEKTTDSSTFKLLLLGTGESGKSTLFKQMLSIYGTPPTQEQLNDNLGCIQHNVFVGMYILCKNTEKWGSVSPENQTAWEYFGTQTTIGQSHPYASFKLEPLQVQYIEQLWKDPVIQNAWNNRQEFQIGDSVEYFMEKLSEIAAPDYNVTQDDYLRLRIRTTGIVENSFTIDKNIYRIFDVGGQRNERKKWIHCFEKVSVVIFVAAMSEYDQKLAEDESTNRLSEALTLFEDISNLTWFKNTSMLLMLNKADLFEQKLKKVPLKDYFPAFSGPNTYEAASKWIEKEFISKSPGQKKGTNSQQAVYPYCTTAVDSKNIRALLNSVKDTIVLEALRQMGMS